MKSTDISMIMKKPEKLMDMNGLSGYLVKITVIFDRMDEGGFNRAAEFHHKLLELQGEFIEIDIKRVKS